MWAGTRLRVCWRPLPFDSPAVKAWANPLFARLALFSLSPLFFSPPDKAAHLFILARASVPLRPKALSFDHLVFSLFLLAKPLLLRLDVDRFDLCPAINSLDVSQIASQTSFSSVLDYSPQVLFLLVFASEIKPAQLPGPRIFSPFLLQLK